MGFMFYVWLKAMIVAVIVEISTTELISFWFALGALFALVSNLFLKNEYIWIQVSIFAIVSIASILFFKPLVRKKMQIPKVATNIDALIGKIALVTSSIESNQPGAVKAEGIEWTAISETDSFEPGDLVEIEKVAGNTLFVKRNKKEI